LVAGWTDWNFRCRYCGYEGSSLQQSINVAIPSTLLDEGLRREALEALRLSNFEDLLRIMARHRRADEDLLLDVGAAHGWFVRASSQARPPWRAFGLEPDVVMAALAQSEGLPVRQGFFPQGLEPTTKVHAITFNDVFEHLQDLPSVLTACRAHLYPQGLLVLNLPSSRGVLFWVATYLQRLGISGPVRRLWQEGMPSPHLHYFHAGNLTRLLQRHGFEVLEKSSLNSIRREGLFARLLYDPRSRWMAPLLGPLLWVIAPLLQVLPADIVVVVARVSKAAQAADRYRGEEEPKLTV
jgi:hypothetical protein